MPGGQNMTDKIKEAVRELMSVPGIGRSIAGDCIELGIYKVKQLAGRSPEELYEKLCSIKGQKIDRCMLYVFRCAVYYASNKKHDQEKLKWWNWKDGKNQ